MQHKPHISIFTFFKIPMLVNYKTANCPTTVAAYESEPSIQKCINFRNIPLGYTNIEFRFSFSQLLPFLRFVKRELTKNILLQLSMKRNRKSCFLLVRKIYVPWIINWKRSICIFLLSNSDIDHYFFDFAIVIVKCNFKYILIINEWN